jgi:signal transduction histidine kinase/ligand-binding sensor domain-containing protein
MAALALAVVVPTPASAQYRIDTWTTEQGLPQNSVNDVLQTRDGFIWLTTFGGLVRFDGAAFRVFNTVNTPALRTSRLTGLVEDADGALWIGTDGFGVVRYRDGAFTPFTMDEGLPANRVSHLFPDADRRVIVDTPKGLVEWRDNRFQPRPGMPTLADPSITILDHTPAGAIWYFGAAGITKWERDRVTRTLPLPRPRRVFEDRAGRLWMETQERRLVRADADRVIEYGEADGVVKVATAAMSDDREGNVWIGMRGGGGLLRFRDGAFVHFAKGDGLPSDQIGAVFQDREGTHWVPTTGGLARLTGRPIAAFGVAEGLAADNTYAVYQDRAGDIWIGGWSGLTRVREGAFTSVGEQMGFAGENVQSILEDRDGAMWFGSFGGSVRRIRGSEMSTVMGPKSLRAIYQDRAGTVWIGGQGGLGRIRDGAFVPEPGYNGGDVHVLFEDRPGTLWIGTDRGATRYRAGAFSNVGPADGLSGPPVRAIHEDAGGTLWFGTYDGGLFRYSDGKFTRITTQQGLPTNGAFRIIEDERGWFWMTSNAGIYRVARSELEDVAAGRAPSVTAVVYGQRDGMRHSECNGGSQPAGIRARDGRIWFPTQQGVAVFDPATIPINRQPPPVVITDVLVANVPVTGRSRIEIRSGSTAVDVQFAALTFIRPELSHFRFRMDGLDTGWIDAGQQRMARYAQLPYGTFRFHVTAANRDGVWNPEGASLDIVVVPPFWRTRWFLALVVFGTAAIGVAVHRWRMGMLRQQKRLGEAFSRQLIDTQEEERRRVAAGLHDSLSQTLMLMKNWAVIGRNTLPPDHQACAPLNDISVAASHALSEVREISHNLGPYQLERIGFAQTVQDMVDKVASASGIRFTMSLTAPDGLLPKEQQIAAFRVIQEALNNIIKHSGATEASIVMRAEPSAVRVSIHDNGRGFDPASVSLSHAHGFGLFGMSERIRLVGGRFHVESSGTGGTLVEFDVPCTGASL